MITSYSFGKMEIDGNYFSSDLIIFPDGRIRDNWHRQSGHVLTLEDLSELTAAQPELIIAGTGANDRMALAPGLSQTLTKMDIEIQAMKTADAVDLFNKLTVKKNVKNLGACFHLTC